MAWSDAARAAAKEARRRRSSYASQSDKGFTDQSLERLRFLKAAIQKRSPSTLKRLGERAKAAGRTYFKLTGKMG